MAPQTDTTTSAYDRAIAYAAAEGTTDGRAAGSWIIDGNTSEAAARAILRGLADGDPAVLDMLPAPDLSGQYADGLTGPALVEAAIVNADDWSMSRADWVAYWAALDPFTDVCDAYEMAFSEAVAAVVERSARAILSRS